MSKSEPSETPPPSSRTSGHVARERREVRSERGVGPPKFHERKGVGLERRLASQQYFSGAKLVLHAHCPDMILAMHWGCIGTVLALYWYRTGYRAGATLVLCWCFSGYCSGYRAGAALGTEPARFRFSTCTVVVLNWFCAGSVVVLYRHALLLRWSCTGGLCAGLALVSHWVPYWYYTGAVVVLVSCCSGTVVVMR